MSEEKIKIALIKAHKSQRWLLGELKKVGFPGLTAANLSRIIRRKYKGTKDYADSVLEAVEGVLRLQKKEVKYTNGEGKRPAPADR